MTPPDSAREAAVREEFEKWMVADGRVPAPFGLKRSEVGYLNVSVDDQHEAYLAAATARDGEIRDLKSEAEVAREQARGENALRLEAERERDEWKQEADGYRATMKAGARSYAEVRSALGLDGTASHQDVLRVALYNAPALASAEREATEIVDEGGDAEHLRALRRQRSVEADERFDAAMKTIRDDRVKLRKSRSEKHQLMNQRVRLKAALAKSEAEIQRLTAQLAPAPTISATPPTAAPVLAEAERAVIGAAMAAHALGGHNEVHEAIGRIWAACDRLRALRAPKSRLQQARERVAALLDGTGVCDKEDLRIIRDVLDAEIGERGRRE